VPRSVVVPRPGTASIVHTSHAFERTGSARDPVPYAVRDGTIATKL